jgi:hypothetical protein
MPIKARIEARLPRQAHTLEPRLKAQFKLLKTRMQLAKAKLSKNIRPSPVGRNKPLGHKLGPPRLTQLRLKAQTTKTKIMARVRHRRAIRKLKRRKIGGTVTTKVRD